MEEPSFANDRDNRRLSLEEHAHLGIGLHGDASSAGASEGCDASVFPRELRRLGEKCRISRVRPRPSALDKINAKRVQLLGHTNLVED